MMIDVKGVAIAGLVVLESVALITHTDGAYFGIVVALVAGLAGYSLHDVIKENLP